MKFNLRMPLALKLRLIAAAKENGRSLNAEIIQRLKLSLDGWKQ
jgi:predicted HicB family RNase H-like nuclease